MVRIDVLRPYIDKTVKEFLGVDSVVVDSDGDIPIRFESAIYYIRLLDRDPALVRVFSVFLRGVEKSPALFEALNQINADVVSARVFWAGGDVYAVTEIVAETMDPDELKHACWAVGSLAAWADTDLQSRFGGQLNLSDDGDDTVDV
jgi:Putative bacterial sensory transduction regulator